MTQSFSRIMPLFYSIGVNCCYVLEKRVGGVIRERGKGVRDGNFKNIVYWRGNLISLKFCDLAVKKSELYTFCKNISHLK